MTTFFGYRRSDGRVGVRNHVLVLPTVSCANRVVMGIVRAVSGLAYVTHPYGCTFDENENETITRTLAGFASNPNVFATVLVSLGCETVDAEDVAGRMEKAGGRVAVLKIQKQGGARATVERGVALAEQFSRETKTCKRCACDVSELTVGLECGASDAASGISANPAVGVASDWIVEHGGTVILSETTEMVGAEGILASRAINEPVRQRLLQIVARAERGLAWGSPDGQGIYLAPGNIEGGLTTIAEKSLGCVEKAGNASIREVIDYAESPSEKGLIVMDTPGYDVASVTGMVAGGAQLVLFTTGRGTPTGCAVAPVIKVCSNTPTSERLADDIDIDAGLILDGRCSIEEMGASIVEHVLSVASGEQTKSESWPDQEFAVATRSVIEEDILSACDQK